MPSPPPQPAPAPRITIVWHAQENLAELTHQNVVLDSPAVIPWWRQQIVPQLEAIHQKLGRKFPLLVCLDELTIRPSVADDYGVTAKTVTTRICSRVARYGLATTVRPLIATEALKMDYKANLFDSRAAAVKFLQT